MVTISAIYLLFLATPKDYNMIFVYSTEILISTNNPQLEMAA